ncbi:hypothetical protein LJR074_002190 [Acidovorax sp. LjRoot74]|uniref:hypothetical protein n=1 Tax=Acidovorax sp. LjRoot74 TaxID=3342337 RepID=UPI003ECDAC27
MGDAFSAETFLTNLAAMSGPARTALFANSGFPGLRQKIETMGKMAANRREGSHVFANPSGTARQIGLGAWASTLIGGLASGNPMVIAGALSTPVIANAAARKATSPKLVRSLAERAQLSKAAGPSALAAGAREDE